VMNNSPAVPDSQDGSPPPQHRGVGVPTWFSKRPAPNSARNWGRISKGQVSTARVNEHQPITCGTVLTSAGIDGLLARHRYRLAPVNHPTEVLTIGQTVKVKIIKINHETHASRLGSEAIA